MLCEVMARVCRSISRVPGAQPQADPERTYVTRIGRSRGWTWSDGGYVFTGVNVK